MTSTHRPNRSARFLRPLALSLAIAAVPTTAVVATTAAAAPSPAAATTQSCAVTWGSLVKSRAGMSSAPITNVRSGRHACYDRLVVDLAGPVSGYQVEYVDAVHQDGSGDVVPLRGGARLRVIVRAPAYDSAGNATYSPRNKAEIVDVSGYSTFRQVALAGSFEGQTTIGLGVRARLPMNVFTLAGPGAGSRMVIDVAHRW